MAYDNSYQMVDLISIEHIKNFTHRTTAKYNHNETSQYHQRSVQYWSNRRGYSLSCWTLQIGHCKMSFNFVGYGLQTTSISFNYSYIALKWFPNGCLSITHYTLSVHFNLYWKNFHLQQQRQWHQRPLYCIISIYHAYKSVTYTNYLVLISYGRTEYFTCESSISIVAFTIKTNPELDQTHLSKTGRIFLSIFI